MTDHEIVSASKTALFERLRALQKEFDAGEWEDPLPIVREHYAVMNELKRRGLTDLQIEVGRTVGSVD